MKLLTYLAQLTVGDKSDQVNNIPTVTASQALANGLYIVYWVTGVAAVIVIIIAGFRYVTSGGDTAAVAKAKNTILYAVIGLVVIILAFVITQFVLGVF